MTIKVDLEKAYDKLEWSFILETLLKANLHSDLVDLIMNCVSSTTISMLFNGGNIEHFDHLEAFVRGTHCPFTSLYFAWKC